MFQKCAFELHHNVKPMHFRHQQKAVNAASVPLWFPLCPLSQGGYHLNYFIISTVCSKQRLVTSAGCAVLSWYVLLQNVKILSL